MRLLCAYYVFFMMERIENDYETGLLVEKSSGDRQDTLILSLDALVYKMTKGICQLILVDDRVYVPATAI